MTQYSQKSNHPVLWQAVAAVDIQLPQITIGIPDQRLQNIKDYLVQLVANRDIPEVLIAGKNLLADKKFIRDIANVNNLTHVDTLLDCVEYYDRGLFQLDSHRRYFTANKTGYLQVLEACKFGTGQLHLHVAARAFEFYRTMERRFEGGEKLLAVELQRQAVSVIGSACSYKADNISIADRKTVHEAVHQLVTSVALQNKDLLAIKFLERIDKKLDGHAILGDVSIQAGLLKGELIVDNLLKENIVYCEGYLERLSQKMDLMPYVSLRMKSHFHRIKGEFCKSFKTLTEAEPCFKFAWDCAVEQGISDLNTELDIANLMFAANAYVKFLSVQERFGEAFSVSVKLQKCIEPYKHTAYKQEYYESLQMKLEICRKMQIWEVSQQVMGVSTKELTVHISNGERIEKPDLLQAQLDVLWHLKYLDQGRSFEYVVLEAEYFQTMDEGSNVPTESLKALTMRLGEIVTAALNGEEEAYAMLHQMVGEYAKKKHHFLAELAADCLIKVSSRQKDMPDVRTLQAHIMKLEARIDFGNENEIKTNWNDFEVQLGEFNLSIESCMPLQLQISLSITKLKMAMRDRNFEKSIAQVSATAALYGNTSLSSAPFVIDYAHELFRVIRILHTRLPEWSDDATTSLNESILSTWVTVERAVSVSDVAKADFHIACESAIIALCEVGDRAHAQEIAEKYDLTMPSDLDDGEYDDGSNLPS